mmetsp:Transcript_14153/g.31931  ORF Transcript_14153/g.31931 Transcript_14153/m.31931 type:complete len:290 (+) Transcript_14153:79-948(+)
MGRGASFLEGCHVELALQPSHHEFASAGDYSHGSFCLAPKLRPGSRPTALSSAFLSNTKSNDEQLDGHLPSSRQSLHDGDVAAFRPLYSGRRHLSSASKGRLISEFLSGSSPDNTGSGSTEHDSAQEHTPKESGDEKEGFWSWLLQFLGLASKHQAIAAPASMPETSEKVDAIPPPPAPASTEASSDEVVAQEADETATLAGDVVSDASQQVAEAEEAGELADNYAIYVLVINLVASVGMLGVVAFNWSTYKRWFAHKKEFARCWQYACSSIGRPQRDEESQSGAVPGD